MPPSSLPSFVVGLVFAAILLAIGYFLGRRRTTPAGADEALVTDSERQRIVGLLEGLSRWTTEYSGNVSNYQTQIGELGDVVRQSLADNQSDGGSQREANDARLVTLVSQMMNTNETLQSRLDAAEQQLAEQTQQIESYLTEARTDGLTGLFNRRAFDKKLDELFGTYRSGGAPFVLILIDIDHFKRINDNHGHPVGDLVLQHIATQLNGAVKDALIVARFGGEEFAILTDAPIRMAAQQMNDFRKAFAAQPISAGSKTLTVTLSVGLSLPREDLAIGPLVRRADEALYASKNRGRDRVYFDDGDGPQLVGAPEIAKSVGGG